MFDSTQNRKPTGVEIIDALIGGLVPDGTHMHCAPIGQGKTTLSLQLLAEVAKHEFETKAYRKCLYFNLEGNVTAKAVLASAGARVDRNLRKFDPGDSERLQQFCNVMQTCIVFKDLRERQVERIQSIRRFAVHHQQPALIVIDSLSALVDMDTSDSGQIATPRIYQEYLEAFKALAVEAKCPVWITHQLASEQNQLERGTAPDIDQTYGANRLWQYVTAGFASGLLDKTNHACFRCFHGCSQAVGQLRSDMACWSLAIPGWQIWDGKASKRKERFAVQKYGKPGWDPRSAGFAV